MIQLLKFHQLIKLKNTLGGLATLIGVFAFSYVYYSAKNGISLDGLYWLSTCFVFSVFSGLLFYENTNRWVGNLYLMSFGFFTLCFIFSLADFICLDRLRMSKVYWALISSALLTTITYFYKWIKHNLF